MGAVPAIAGWVAPSPVLWPWVLVVGVSALSGHFCMAKALGLADATVVVPMDFLRLPLIALVGYLFYNETLDMFVFTGALFMLAGNLVSIRAEKKTPVLRQ
jgi:drug/metabolite transporter (DMT)-like permease